MTVGLPGASIGGLFYVLSALLMPLRELFRRVARPVERRFWRRALGQSGIALAIVGVTWGTGWTLGRVIVHGAARHGVMLGSAASTSSAQAHVGLWSMIALFLALITLSVVLIGVQLLRVFVRRPASSALSSGTQSSRARIRGANAVHSAAGDEGRFRRSAGRSLP